MLHLVVAGAAAGAAGAAGALGLHIVINDMAIMVIFPIVLSSCPSVFPGSRAKVFYVPGPADAAFHRRPFGPVLTRSYRGLSRLALPAVALPQLLPRCGRLIDGAGAGFPSGTSRLHRTAQQQPI